jgi:hypothetical protein
MSFKFVFLCLVIGGLLLSGPPVQSAGAVDAFPGMVVDLGQKSPYVKITPDYTKAAVSAVLPYFSETAAKLDLPITRPILQSDISKSNVLPFRELTVSVLLNNGWAFDYSFGYVRTITNTRGYSSLQNPAEIPRYYGEVRMTKDEAVQFARETLEKLGISLEDIFADQEPQITMPERIGTNTIPHYEIIWFSPNGEKSVDMGINANTKQIDRLSLRNRNLERSRPKLNAAPDQAPLEWPSTNPEYARQLIPMMLKAIDDYGQKLSLPVPRPLTTNYVARVRITDNGGWPDCDVVLTNGWRFVYRHTMVNGYYSPHVLLTDILNRGIKLKNFQGKWNMGESEAIQLVKQKLAKLNFPTNDIHMDFAPYVTYAQGDFKKSVPRYFFQWLYENATHDDLQSKIEAEVNADTGTVESLYYDDKAYWNSRPPINVPISVRN